MPRSVTLPNGFVVNDVPDNVTDDMVYQKAISKGKMSKDDLSKSARSVKLPNGFVVENVPADVPDEVVFRKAIEKGKMSNEDLPPSNDVMSGAYWRQTMANAPGSLLNQGQELLEAVTHPVRTFNNIADVAAGGIGNLFNIEESDNPGFLGIPRGARGKASALAEMYRNRYGSGAQAAETFREDPFAVLGDVGAALTGVGGAAKGLGALGGASALRGAGEAVGRVGSAIDPVNILGNVAAAPVRAMGAGAFPTRLAQSAVGSNERVANLMLEQGYKMTPESFDKFKRDYNNLQYEGAIANLQGDSAKLAEINDRLKSYQQAFDVYPSAIQRAQQEKGSLSQHVVIPAGAGYGIGMAIDQVLGTPGVFSSASPVAAVALGALEKRSNKLGLAQYLSSMKSPSEAFFDNDIYKTVSHQAIREIGSNEANNELEAALKGVVAP